MRSGAERAARIDDHWCQPVRRPLPRRPDPQRPDDDRNVESLPLLVPAGGDGSGRHVDEGLPQPGHAPLIGERDELDGVVASLLGEPVGEELEHSRPRLLDPDAGDDDRRADEAQRKALFSFSKKLSSAR